MYCEASVYQSYRIIVVLTLLLFVIGFPVSSILFLRKNKSTVEDAVQLALTRRKNAEMGAAHNEHRAPRKSILLLTATTSVAPVPVSDSTDAIAFSRLSSFLCRYGPLFASYRGNAWWWSSFTLVRRALFTTVDVALVATPVTKFMAFCFLNIYTLCGHALMQPFVSEELNRADWAAQLMLVTISVLLTAHPPPYDTSIQVALFLLIVPTTLVLALLVVRQLRPLLLQLAMRMRSSFLSLRRLGSQVQSTNVSKYTSSDLTVDAEQMQDNTAPPTLELPTSPSRQLDTCVSPRAPQAWVTQNQATDPTHSSTCQERPLSPLASPSGVQMHPLAEDESQCPDIGHRKLPPLRIYPRQPTANMGAAATVSSEDIPLRPNTPPPHTLTMHVTASLPHSTAL